MGLANILASAKGGKKTNKFLIEGQQDRDCANLEGILFQRINVMTEKAKSQGFIK